MIFISSPDLSNIQNSLNTQNQLQNTPNRSETESESSKARRNCFGPLTSIKRGIHL